MSEKETGRLIAVGAIQLADAVKNPSLSTAQKRFNKLVKNISAERQRIVDWELALNVFRQGVSTLIHPILQEDRKFRGAIVEKLDQAWEGKMRGRKFTARQRQHLGEVIGEAAASLFNSTREDRWREIYEKHSAVMDEKIKEEMRADAIALRKSSFHEFGIELGEMPKDASLEAMDEWMERARSIIREASQSSDADNDIGRVGGKSARVKETKLAKNVAESIKDIYRKLASALHPDRAHAEISSDRQQALMARVNNAYAQNNLLALLEAQLEIEQIDQAHISALGEEKLVTYNKIMRIQLFEIVHEKRQITEKFNRSIGLPIYRQTEPEMLPERLNERKEAAKKELAERHMEYEELVDNETVLKWLKKGAQQ